MAVTTLVERGDLSDAARRFLGTESGSAVLLVGAAVAALVWANLGDGYESFWHTSLAVQLGGTGLDLDLRHWVNDGLMVLFFLSVGLEIARETTLGELRGFRAIAAPAAAAVGGLVVPALVFLALNSGSEAANAWGIAISTDTAVMLGVLALLGPRCPDQLRVFLLALAIVDDIGAVAAIALFYTDEVDVLALLVAVVLLVGLLALRYVRFWRTPFYAVVGVLCWLAVLRSGVHPSVVGVALGLLVNAYAPRREDMADAMAVGKNFLLDPTPERARTARIAAVGAVSPNERLQLRIQPWSSYVIVPLFVLANAGVVLDAETLSAAAGSLLTWGIVLGLVVGKPIGVAAGTWLVLRTGIGKVPDTLRWGQLLGGSALSGIGFTVALFVTELALDDELLIAEAKIGILTGSVLAAVAGWLVFRLAGERGGQCSPSGLPTLPPRPWRPVD
ncbi:MULTISPECIES: Na+/H+ antiporter NhaA [unclassified Pseudonocardia]|uniref:Na+/H+ antiporter NhaA n=1 Tax=unclassified Pseudonocardia TaxID=2619320 RepID=UPI0001FFEF6C|nr:MULTISPECIES: Na+/H+ antiporter NhaA [unclassified Pseudonocardia]ALE72563.1 sodium:proton antiporter [Pseudonocardia sp. EC080625-04]ALL75878.1 sodium:proton antiporter [Pseudonocardia sp. EC080610-09]ALL82905.1 sodium:proton antiporter [Pseudonocardia sp. EC080619-01]OLM20133.1 Na+/H+ antiporter NhaA type [Pseudonocardia sp. Ae707_Ps1]